MSDLDDVITKKSQADALKHIASTEAKNRKEARRLFHELWADNVGTKNYDKSNWRDFRDALEKLGVSL